MGKATDAIFLRDALYLGISRQMALPGILFTMSKASMRILVSVLIAMLLGSVALVSGSGTSLAVDIAYYEVTSSSYDQAVGIPFAVTIVARDSLHNLVRGNAGALTISSNSHGMTFDTNNNGIFGEDSDSTGVLSGRSMKVRPAWPR